MHFHHVIEIISEASQQSQQLKWDQTLIHTLILQSTLFYK